MSIKDDLEKSQTGNKKGKARDIGKGFIKVEVKDGQIEASTSLNVPNDTLVMILIVLESLQRAIAENDSQIKDILQNLRRISDKELVQLVKEHAVILEAGRNASSIH